LLVVALLVSGVAGWAQTPAGSAPVAASAESSAESGTASLAALRRLIENGHGEQALVQLDALAGKAPVPAGVETLRGLAFYNGKRFQEAAAAFGAALAVDPHDEEAAEMRGLTLFRMGKPAEAIPLLEGSLRSLEAGSGGSSGQLSGGSGGQAGQASGGEPAQAKADPHYVLALCYIDTRRYDDARHAFAAQYGFGADSAAAYLLAARMLLRREYLPVAQGFAEKAIALDPTLPLAHALLGEIALGGNHLEEAIAQFTEEQRRNPLEPSVYDRLGDAYSRSGRYGEATAALQRAVLLEPNATGPYILLGKVMLKRQDAVGAATYLERAKQMDPANYMTRNLLGQAYRAMGRRDEAAAELQAAEQLQAASEPKLASPQ
jgi:tetratricopeptide (TPR) repeat protein